MQLRMVYLLSFLVLLAGPAVVSAQEDRFYCHTCVSSSFRDCVWNPYTSLTKDCLTGDRACATVILPNGHTYRGCSQDEECIAAGDDCVRCDRFSGCNIDRYPADRLRCNICQSSQSTSCQALPYPRQFEKPCVRYVAGDRCVTVFDQFNVSYRDCLSAVPEVDLPKCDGTIPTVECAVCYRWHCNTVKVRQDDRCLQCTSNMTHCSSGQRSATVCEQPSEGRCYSKVNEQQFLVRGCWVDLTNTEQQEACNNDARNCAVCEGAGCNAEFLPQDTLSCVQCDSKQQLSCAQQQLNNSNVQFCRRHVTGDRCYVRTIADGSLQRGCKSDVDNESGCTEASCGEYCTGNNCNRDVYPSDRLSCYQCNSEQSLDCDVDQHEFNLERALRCRFHLNNDGCYVRINQNKVIRGCLSDLGNNSEPCKGLDASLCRICYGNDCNYISQEALRNTGRPSQPPWSIFCLLLSFLQLILPLKKVIMMVLR